MSDDENEDRWIFADEAAELQSMDELLEIMPKFRGRINGAKFLSVNFGEPGLLRKFFRENAEEEKYRWFTPPLGSISMVDPSAIIKLDDGHSSEKLNGCSEDLLVVPENLVDVDDWTCCVCKKELPCYREDKSIIGVAFRREQLGIEETKVYCHDCAEEERYLEDGSWLPDLAKMYKSVRRCAEIEDNLFHYNIPGNQPFFGERDPVVDSCKECQCEIHISSDDVFSGCPCSPNKGEEKQ